MKGRKQIYLSEWEIELLIDSLWAMEAFAALDANFKDQPHKRFTRKCVDVVRKRLQALLKTPGNEK